MNKESILESQKIDANCNDCIFLERDFDKYNSFDKLYTNDKGEITRPSYRINYGNCKNLKIPISFIPNTCQLHTQNCFKHRKDNLQIK